MLRSSCKKIALLVAMGVAAALPASAQLVDGAMPVELGVNYVADISNAHPGFCGCFAMQGGGVNVTAGFTSHIWVAGDLSIVHANTVPGTNYSLGLITLMGGPQYRLSAMHSVTPYAQVLFGAVRGFDSVFPGSAGSASAFAFEIGSGVTVPVGHRFSVRAVGGRLSPHRPAEQYQQLGKSPEDRFRHRLSFLS